MDQGGVWVDRLAEVLWWTECPTVTTGVAVQKGVGMQTEGQVQVAEDQGNLQTVDHGQTCVIQQIAKRELRFLLQ